MSRIARLLLAVGMLLTISMPAVAFDDVADSDVFVRDIQWLSDSGITRGCNPPDNSRFCPDDAVTRGQMAAFLTRALDLPRADNQGFVDTTTSVFTTDIDALAHAGITRGCNPPTNNRFCPDDAVTRGQMAAFLHRALGSSGAGVLYFSHAGDLFSHDVATGARRSFGALDGRQGAFFSPDGTVFTSNAIAGTNDARVFVSSLPAGSGHGEFLFGGRPIQDELGIRPSPGGTHFASIVHGSGGPVLRITDATGTAVMTFESPAIAVTGHAWTPSGGLVFVGHNAVERTGVFAHLADVTDPDSLSIIREEPSSAARLPRELAVSADGKRIAYPFDGGIWVGSLTEAASDHREAVTSPRTLARPAFSPDGRSLAVVMLDGALGRGDIHVVSVPTAGSTHITPTGPTRLAGPNQGGVWSSGGDSALGWFTR